MRGAAVVAAVGSVEVAAEAVDSAAVVEDMAVEDMAAAREWRHNRPPDPRPDQRRR